MNDILLAARKDLLRRARDPLSLVFWLSIPLAITLLFRFAFGGDDGKIPAAKLALADLDDSFVSRLIPGALGQGALADLIEVVPVADSLEAYQLALKGKVSAALILPRGFGDALLDRRTTRLALFRNPAQQVLPVIVEEVLEGLAEGAFYARELLGEPIETIRNASTQSTRLDDTQALGLARTFEQIFADDGPQIIPPSLTVHVDQPETPRTESSDYFFMLFPGLVFMSLLFTAQALATDLWDEHTQGTYKRHQVSRRGRRAFLWGKTIAAGVVLLVVQTALFGVGRLLLGLQFANLIPAVLFSTLSGVAFVSFFQWISVVARRENDATILMSFMIMPLVLLGGSFFPIREMPPFLAAIAERTPNGWLAGRLERLLAGQPEPGALAMAVVACALIAVVCTKLADAQARRRFTAA